MVNTNYISKIGAGVIALVVLFLLLAELIPEAQTAGNTLNATGAPLAGLFASDGVVVLIIMAGVVLAVMGAFWYKGRK